MPDKPEKSDTGGGLDDAFDLSQLDVDALGVEPAVLAAGAVSVHIVVQVGATKRDWSALASTSADPYKVARGLLTGLRTDADDWLLGQQS